MILQQRKQRGGGALEEQPQLSISQPNASSSQKRKTRKPEEPETKDQRQKGI